MNWTRTILDGLMMAAYFNFFAMAVVLCNNRLMFPCYPDALQEAAPEPPTKGEKTFYWVWICVFMLIPLLAYAIASAHNAGMTGFWPLAISGFVQWNMVSLCDLLFLDWFGITKLRDKLVVPGTEGHEMYETANWMKKYALPEHLLQWPLIMAPLMGAIQGGIGILLH